MVPQLIAKNGSLYIQITADDGTLYLSILHVIYKAGDCDTIPWPLTEKFRPHLASALFDEYEMGNLSERTVALPDGTAFNIDMNMPTKMA